MQSLNPIILAAIAGLSTWGITALGAALVFILARIKQLPFGAIVGFASGIMLAASFYSLLLPCAEYARMQGISPAFPMLGGLLLGFFIMFLLEHYEAKRAKSIQPGRHSEFRLLFLAITLHNIPEGLAIGVAFGAIMNGGITELASAVALAIGIGIQNFPEGIAVALPARRAGYSPLKSFMFGQGSALVEPPFAVFGAVCSVYIFRTLPFFMAFAAGAMVYASFELLISCVGKECPVSAVFASIGFLCMTALDTLLS